MSVCERCWADACLQAALDRRPVHECYEEMLRRGEHAHAPEPPQTTETGEQER